MLKPSGAVSIGRSPMVLNHDQPDKDTPSPPNSTISKAPRRFDLGGDATYTGDP